MRPTRCPPRTAGPHKVYRDADWGWRIANHVVRVKPERLAAPRVQRCRAQGLLSRPELNGQPCTIEGYAPERGRYRVRFNNEDPNAAGVLRGFSVEYGGEVLGLRPACVVLPKMARVKVSAGSDYSGREGRISHYTKGTAQYTVRINTGRGMNYVDVALNVDACVLAFD